MTDTVQTLGVRLNAQGLPEFTNGMSLGAAATEAVGKKADAAGKALGGNTEQMKASGNTARQTAAAWRLLPAQMTDVVTSLASGSPAWLVAIQQGGQIKDSFGGVGPMFKELAGALTLSRVAIGGTAAAVGLLLYAYAQGEKEARAYQLAILGTGNAAGTSAGQLQDMARATEASLGSQGKAAQAVTALAATGEVANRNLGAFKDTALRMERELSTPLEETAQHFQELGRAPLEASLKLNRGVNYLTAAVYDQIRALQAEGKVREAGEVAQKAYAAAMDERTKKAASGLGTLERWTRNVGTAGKWMWDQLLDIGRPDTLQQKLDKTNAKLREIEQSRRSSLGMSYGVYGGSVRQEEARLQAERAATNRAMLNEAEQGASDASKVAQMQQELRDRERANVEAGIAVELAQATSAAAQRQAVAELDLARARAIGTARASQLAVLNSALEDQRQRDVVSLSDYYERRAALEQQGLAAEIATVDAEMQAERRRADARAKQLDAQIAAEARRQAENPAEAAQQQARLIELAAQRQAQGVETESRLTELRAQRGRLEVQQAESARDAERQSAAASAAVTERWLEDVDRRRQALAQLNDQQQQANAATAVDLIADPYARAAAKARLDIDQLNRYYTEQLAGLRARLPALDSSDPDQAAAVRRQILQAEQQKNDAIVLRQKQLTEDLKPEWQRQLEAWSDHTRQMREAFDEFQSGWLDSGRNAWQEYLRTGKMNVDSLGAFMRQQLGDQVFKQAIAPTFSQIGQGIATLLGMGSGPGDGGAEAALMGQAGESTARSLNTAAVNTSTTAMSSLALSANSAASALTAVAASGGGSSGVVGLLGSIGSIFAGGGSGGGAPSDAEAAGLIGGRASGGDVQRGRMYEVNERGPELLSVNNRTYLMMGGKDGYVVPNGRGGQRGGADGRGGLQLTYAPQISIDSRSDRADVERLVSRAVRSGQVELMDMMRRGQA